MKTIATKSVGVGILYILCLIIGIILTILGFSTTYILIIAIPIVGVSLYIVIDYFKTLDLGRFFGHILVEYGE
jgi:nicotinamide riboside transporter PnuC